MAFLSHAPLPGRAAGRAPPRNPTRAASAPPPAPVPLLLRAARGEKVERPPVWLMRQAGRYMSEFRKYSDLHPFRHRSETPSIATALSLQPYHAFSTDAVIMFSDILTPLPAIGRQFDIVRGRGPRILRPIRAGEQVEEVLRATFDPHADLPFVAEVLANLRCQLEGSDAALLGFVGAPFTLAAYLIEGKAVKNLAQVKRFMYSHDSEASEGHLQQLLSKLTQVISEYCVFQIDAGAQAVQIFDSWAHHLSPSQYARFALPYARAVAEKVKRERPEAPLIFFANGSAGKLDDIARAMASVVDVIALDWSVDMRDARRIFGNDVVLQGNIDPSILLVGSHHHIRQSVMHTIRKAEGGGLILNLGHGVIKETPEASVKVFVEAVRNLSPLAL